MRNHVPGLSAVSLVLLSGLAAPALAQDAAAPDLPAALNALNLQNVEIDQTRRGGRKVEGDLPDGGEIDAFIDSQNNVMMVEADDVAMPQSLVEALLPQAVRDNDIMSQFAIIDRIGGRDGRFMVGGENADGQELRAGFDADGRLLRFGGEDDRRGMRGHRWGRGDHGRMMGKGDWGHGFRSGTGGGRMGEGQMPPIDTGPAIQSLNGAGYSELSSPRPAGFRMLIDATNPAGEAVTVEVDPSGQVIRETAR